MMYRKIECPTCGNEVMAKSVRRPQKCEWCGRYYRVFLRKRKGKILWSAIPSYQNTSNNNSNGRRISGLESDR